MHDFSITQISPELRIHHLSLRLLTRIKLCLCNFVLQGDTPTDESVTCTLYLSRRTDLLVYTHLLTVLITDSLQPNSHRSSCGFHLLVFMQKCFKLLWGFLIGQNLNKHSFPVHKIVLVNLFALFTKYSCITILRLGSWSEV